VRFCFKEKFQRFDREDERNAQEAIEIRFLKGMRRWWVLKSRKKE